MVESPVELAWSHWPLRNRPLLAILLAAFLLVVTSLVFFWLGWTWPSGLLLLAFFFSLRDLLFPRSMCLHEEGATISHPLTGVQAFAWDQVESLALEQDRLQVKPRGRRVQAWPLGADLDLGHLQAWLSWFALRQPATSP